MPKFRFTIEAVGRTTTDIIAEDEVEARAIYEEGDWKPAKENWDAYEITDITEIE